MFEYANNSFEDSFKNGKIPHWDTKGKYSVTA